MPDTEQENKAADDTKKLPGPKFKPGDVVHLPSGGQHMTVGRVHGKEPVYCDCQWHDAAGTLQSGNFREEMLLNSYADQRGDPYAPTDPQHSLYTGAAQGGPQNQDAAKDWRDKHGLR
jgi:uncharacterized protein YodC (DUF2158 family)